MKPPTPAPDLVHEVVVDTYADEAHQAFRCNFQHFVISAGARIQARTAVPTSGVTDYQSVLLVEDRLLIGRQPAALGARRVHFGTVP